MEISTAASADKMDLASFLCPSRRANQLEENLSTPLRGDPFSPKRGEEEVYEPKATSLVSPLRRERGPSLDGIERFPAI
jgi:hypothetical protein